MSIGLVTKTGSGGTAENDSVEESKLDQRRSNISQSDMQTSEILRAQTGKRFCLPNHFCVLDRHVYFLPQEIQSLKL